MLACCPAAIARCERSCLAWAPVPATHPTPGYPVELSCASLAFEFDSNFQLEAAHCFYTASRRGLDASQLPPFCALFGFVTACSVKTQAASSARIPSLLACQPACQLAAPLTLLRTLRKTPPSPSPRGHLPCSKPATAGRAGHPFARVWCLSWLVLVEPVRGKCNIMYSKQHQGTKPS